ncbi:MAG: hypothetical protein M5U26_12560 [Planctomycetota bacterium]|nr:hypothetical protein [Planctomycetota bacterium]
MDESIDGGTTHEWIRQTCSFATSDEEAAMLMASPQMRMLLRALHLMGQVALDSGWTQTHDPSGRLKQSIEDLVHVTRIRRPRNS